MNLQEHPHRRYNPLTGEWVKVSPHRTKRPWQGQVEKPQIDELPSYDEHCYLCPGNKRAGEMHNDQYTGTYVFDNDFAALIPDVPEATSEEGPHGMLKAESERGICRVICFSPRHDLTLAKMPQEGIKQVVDTWQEQYVDLGSRPFIDHVQIFENRGEVMGCSNPHPHGQIWAEQRIPDLPRKELLMQESYYREHGSALLADYLDYEREVGTRIVLENDSFVLLVPYWAVWPYEVMILPRFKVSSLAELSEQQKWDLASIMKATGVKLDNLFLTNFPYSMGIHQAPTDGRTYPHLQMHIHYLPPLLRSATIKKFMVGYELMSMPQRDITAEFSASRLRELPDTHYTQGV